MGLAWLRERAGRSGARAAATLWVAGWCLLLYTVATSWRELGGIVGERLLWLARFGALTGVACGVIAARYALEVVEPDSPRATLRMLRLLFYPVGATATVALAALWIARRDDTIGVVLTVFLAYAAGIWLGLWGATTRAIAGRLRPGGTRERG
jgi:hypothetical protein